MGIAGEAQFPLPLPSNFGAAAWHASACVGSSRQAAEGGRVIFRWVVQVKRRFYCHCQATLELQHGMLVLVWVQ
jgi:hypothetical protein